MSEAETGPKLFARLGLAIVQPRWALAIAADRRNAGRSGSDLIVLMLLVLVAVRLRVLLGAVWLAQAVDAAIGMRNLMGVLTRTLTVDLAFLVLGAFVLFAGAGPKRNLGRAFDLACVATVPLLVVELVATTILQNLDITLPSAAGWILSSVTWGWAGALLALSWRRARQSVGVPDVPPLVIRTGRIAARALIALLLVAMVLEGIWIARHLEAVRPVSVGAPSRGFALPVIGPGGALGGKRGIAPGKVTVIDFWATWCQPCLASMPKLERLARANPDVDVIAINLDDPVKARALFDRAGYSMILVADDGEVSERYNVGPIPHTVVIGRDGMVKAVFHGATSKLESTVEEIRK